MWTPYYHVICKYLLPFSRLSFHFVNGFLCCAKTFKFYYVLLVCFCFSFFYFRRHAKKYCYNLCQCYTYLFSRSFMGLYLKFIFVNGVRRCPNFIMPHIFPELLIKEPVFSSLYSLIFAVVELIINVWIYLFLSHSTGLNFCFCASTILF